MTRVLFSLVALTGVLLGTTGCNPILRYNVSQATAEDCIIRTNGEFCDEAEQFPPPTVAVWSIEVREDITYIYIGDETWVAHQLEGPFTILKEERQSRNLCTTEYTRELSFDYDFESLSGTFDERVRTDGPDSCGDTPFGNRRAFTIVGVASEGI